MNGRGRKAKGDRAEREAAELLTDLTGHHCRRKLGAGRKDDEGDLECPTLKRFVFQIASWADTAAAARVKPPEADQQARNAGVDFGVTLVRFRGGTWRAVLTPETLAAMISAVEALDADE